MSEPGGEKTSVNKGLMFAAIGAVAYGLYPPALRAVYADGGNAILMIIAATWVRGLSMAIYCALIRAPLFQSREDRKQAVIGGAFQACSTVSIFLSLLYIPGPLAIIIVFTHTLMLLFFMAWRGEIKLDVLNIMTTISALFGLTLVLDIWHLQSKTHWIGMGLAFITALSAVSRFYVYGKQTRERHPIVVGAENFLVAAILTLLVLLFQTPKLPSSMSGYAFVIVSCASIAFANFCMFYAISILGSFQYSLMAKLEPIFTSLFSVLLLKEILGLHQYFGIGLVVGSLAGYQFLRHKTYSKTPLIEYVDD